MAFPWLENDSVGQKVPTQQQAARISQFNAAAKLEDATKKEFMENFQKERQYEQERQRFLQYKQQRDEAGAGAERSNAATHMGGGDMSAQLPPGVQVDWAGFVVPADRRKVYSNHASQKQTLRQKNGYLVPDAENISSSSSSSTSSSSIHFTTSSHNSKKHFENDQSFQTWDNSGKANPHRTATYQQGPGTNHGTSHWQTSTQSLYNGEQAGDGRGFLPVDKVGSRKKFKPAFEQASAQRLSIHQQPLRELGQQPGRTTQHHHQHGSMTAGTMEPRVDMSHAGGTGMRSRQGHMLSGNALLGLAASVAKVVPRPQAVLKPTVHAYDKLQHAQNVPYGHMPGTTTIQRRSQPW